MSTVLRECSCCGQYKPWDRDPLVRHKKASGFRMGKCWDCSLETYREASREAKRQKYATPEGREATREASRRRNQTPEGKAYVKESNQRRSKPKDWDKDAIVRIQAQAERVGLTTDHIFALRAVDPKTGIRASGLHRSWNLQILSAAENAAKFNRVDFAQEEQRLLAIGRGIMELR